MTRFTLFLGWLVVVAVATTITWQIVSAADERVSERPIAPLNVAAPVIAAATSTTTGVSGASATTPSTSLPGTGTTSTRSTDSATSPTSASTEWKTRSVQTTGGTVNLRYRPGEVTYQSATPAPGFHFDVEKEGPPEVRVDFESESQRVRIAASWNNDDLAINVSEEDEED